MKKVLGFIVTLGLLVLVAACTTSTYTVTFDTNGGSTVSAVTVNENEKITQPTNPTLLGSAFAGWYVDEDLTDAWDFDVDVVTADMTLYAKWTQVIVTFTGVDDVTVEFDVDLDLLDGVTATGNDGADYTDYITFSTIAHLDAENENMLDTTYPGEAKINYKVVVDNVTLGQVWRTITVKSPEAVEGEMLINGDFSNGVAGWNDTAVNYIADGASMDLSIVDGALQVDVVAGVNLFTPRFGQAGLTIENGKTYEVSFKAKSSVEKTINLQVGELLTSDPWFTDFKPGNTVVRTITTEWADYSYKFTMNLETNENGAILFELGTYDGNAVNATLWFDDINIEEATPDADETAPVFSGINESRTVLIGGEFDPLAGVSAFDATDGDVTDDIVVEILDADSEVVTTIDTSAETTYTINYSVTDAAGNEATAVVTLDVVGMQFYEENLIVNGDFDSALGDPAEWMTYVQDWGTVPVTTFTLDETNDVYTVDITGGGDAAWAVQLNQDGITLEEGRTYRILLTAKASVARDLNIAIGEQVSDQIFDEYARFDGVSLTTEYTTQEFVFTVTKATNENIKVSFELGNTANFADGMITFDSIALNEAILDDIIQNGNFADGWTLWYQDWGDMPTVTYNRNDDRFNITTDKPGEADWAIQFNQTLHLEAGKTYVLSVDAMASVARDINIKIFDAGYTFYVGGLDSEKNDNPGQNQMLTTEMATYTFEFTIPEDSVADPLTLSFEMGATANFAAGTVSLDNISLVEKDLEDAPELILNGDATTVLDFELFTESDDTMLLGETGAVVNVTTVGTAAHIPHVFQMISGLDAGTYTLKLSIHANVARDLRMNLVVPDTGYSSILPDTKYDFTTVADDTVDVYVTFTIENAITTDVKFELDFGDLGEDATSVVGMFTIEEVLLYQVFN